MKHSKGKNLQDFVAIFGSNLRSHNTLSDELYEGLSADVGCRASLYVGDRQCLVAGMNPIVSEPPGTNLVFRRTPLGAMPESLVTTLAMEHVATTLIFSHLTPWCASCNAPADKLPAKTIPSLPDVGLVVLTVTGGTHDEITLREWCELLGAERAVVDGTITAASELADVVHGEPILRIFGAEERSLIAPEIERWLTSSGGREIRISHVKGRDAALVSYGVISTEIRCSRCRIALQAPTVIDVMGWTECATCRGHGWLEVDDRRYQACVVCDGYGSADKRSLALCGGTSLRYAASLTWDELGQLIRDGSQLVQAHEHRALKLVVESPFAHYSIGTPVAFLSKKERELLTLLSARLSGFSNLILVSESGCEEYVNGADDVNRGGKVELCLVEPEWNPFPERASTASVEVVRLSQINRGPLDLPEITFPLGIATLIKGESGSGKSLLLQEIAARFKKRRKFAHLGSFAGIATCHYISEGLGREHDMTVSELLSLDGAVAEEFSRTQGARLNGLKTADFMWNKSSHRCLACIGKGPEGSREEWPCELCKECLGSGFGEQVGSVVIGKTSFSQALTLPLAQAKEVLWMSDLLVGVLELLPEREFTRLTLATRISSLSPEAARFLALFGSVAAALVEGRDRRTQASNLASVLFLFDGLFTLTQEHQRIAFTLLTQALSAGCTIIAAGVPKGLEKWFGYVLGFRTVSRPVNDRGRELYFDRRLARVSELHVL